MTNWQHVGRWSGGTVSAIAASPNFQTDGISLAATSAGLYRSIDGGQNWKICTDGFDDPGALAVEFSDQSPMLVLASSEQGRLYHSEDSGTSWTEVVTWAGSGIITALALSPNYPNDGVIFSATSNGLFRTLNDGKEWAEASFGLLDLEVLCLDCAPDFAQSGVLWAGTALGGFFRSRNSGLAWRESGAGLPDCAVQALTPSPNYINDHTLFVGTEDDGVYSSEDGGTNWQIASSDLAGHSVNCLTASRDPSTDSGYRLIAGTDAGIYFSADAGKSWALANAGEVLALDLSATSAETILAATYQAGICLSHDLGTNWHATDGTIAAHAPPLITQTASGTLYALDAHGALAHSVDQGVTWQEAPLNEHRLGVLALAAGEDFGHDFLCAATVDGLFVQRTSVDDGWRAIPCPVDEIVGVALAADHDKGLTLLAAGSEGQIVRCTLETEEWISLALPGQADALLQIAFSPRYGEDQSLYAITATINTQSNFDIQVWQSTNSGVDWEALAALESEVPAVLLHQPHDEASRSILLATQHRIIRLYYEQAEAGAGAKHSGIQLAVSQHIFAADTKITAVTSASSENGTPVLYAATNGGIFRSTDMGDSWDMLCSLPNTRPIVALMIEHENDKPDRLNAVTLGGDFWTRVGK